MKKFSQEQKTIKDVTDTVQTVAQVSRTAQNVTKAVDKMKGKPQDDNIEMEVIEEGIVEKVDGSKGKGGCTYCNNNTFNPDYCKPIKSITQQIEEGVTFFSKTYKSQKYLAYFQAFTNTYAPIQELKEKYNEALKHKDVIGLVIATRPDCISNDVLDYLQQLVIDGYFIKLEFGLESTNNKTLDRINRCQKHEDAITAFDMAKERGILLGGHLILGLPGESKQEILNHAIAINNLPIDTLKIHHLQIVKHTMMAFQYRKVPSQFHFFNLEEYIDLVIEFLEILHPKIII